MMSTAEGLAVTYPGEPFFDAKLHVENKTFEQYTSMRSPGGWRTETGETLNPEIVPTPVLPSVAEGSNPTVLEETPDGSKVFFLDEKHDAGITSNSNAAEHEPDLYEYTVPSPGAPLGILVDLTPDIPGHGDARGILGVGGEGVDEGSYVYFVAGGELAPGAVVGSDNLYLRHNEVTTFIETLVPEDEQGGGNVGAFRSFDWALLPANRTAEVSPSGRYVVFASVATTGVDAGEPEIARYDTDAAGKGEPTIVCVSCSHAGVSVPPASPQRSADAEINGADRQRYVLNDGRVFFDTAASLVPQDTNDQMDVYEWEEGAPHLISAGTSEVSASIFVDASSGGSNVFFTTSQSLVASDGDEITDMYDAKEYGGFPPPPTPACPREAQCSAGSSTGPVAATVPSLTNTATEPPGASVSLLSIVKPSLTKAQLLAKALRTCHKDKRKPKRKGCEAAARRRYDLKKTGRKSTAERRVK
jgi:hypothetical protein